MVLEVDSWVTSVVGALTASGYLGLGAPPPWWGDVVGGVASLSLAAGALCCSQEALDVSPLQHPLVPPQWGRGAGFLAATLLLPLTLLCPGQLLLCYPLSWGHGGCCTADTVPVLPQPPSMRSSAPTFRCIGVRTSQVHVCVEQRDLFWIIHVQFVNVRREKKGPSPSTMMLMSV